MESKYKMGQIVECVSVTHDNVEHLMVGELYVVTGATPWDGTVLYALKDINGDLYYSLDRFKVSQFKIGTKLEDVVVAVPNAVTNPSHYTAGGIEFLDYLKAKLSKEAYKGFLQGNVIKYLSRAGKKDDEVQDLKKAQFYLDKLIKEVELW